ncbi:glycosyltransferase family 2 protein [Modestobacter excelsi]|uniref:glycosyltransferase family 2 protein n=1 Tax=Modestobacter excelsi TaxID=2213161 RepID=UPI001C20E3D7|nr:glycosyltransferase family 2 protein [Modestobacter excelsi]
MTRTSVVVVAYRSSGYLERGLPALLRDPAVGDVVVVDNSSDPATARVVGRADGRVRYVDPGANLGFARGCNLGMRATSDPVVTFLNPDVLLEQSLAELVDRCGADDRMVLGGGLTGEAGGALGNARRRETLGTELRRAVLGAGSSLQPVAADTGTIAVPQVDGAFLIAHRTFLELLDGYDERFELYFEDVDICDRARVHGRVLLDTRRFGSHAGGGSSRTVAAVSYCVFRVSRIRYFAKRGGRAAAAAALVVAVAEVVARTLTRQPEGWRVRWRALRLSAREAWRPGTVRVLS